MNPKRAIGTILSVTVLLLLAAGVRMAQSPGVAAEAPRVPARQPAAQPASQPAAHSDAIQALAPLTVTEAIADAIVTQTFALNAGWNTIYLGVEPINPSPLDDQGIHTKSVMEAVFGDLAGLDSVWTYSQPVSNKDYIVDPGEGLWDDPGWQRYLPESSADESGQSRGFLTTLHTLHANTGYLVKMNSSGSITVSGKPVPGHHRWAIGAYNLAGFPIDASANASQWPTIASFIPGYGPTGDITEVRGLTPDGRWTAIMAGTDMLAPGVAYLVRYADAPSRADYTAPLDLASQAGTGLPSEGLDIKAGLYSNRAKLLLRNLTGSSVDAVLSLPQAGASKVALYYVRGTNDEVDLRSNSPTVTVAGGSEVLLEFKVPTLEQPAAGESMLAISASALGVRWLVPLSSAPAARGGLWLGDVTINDVSQARLGTSDERALTVRMVAANSSGVSGTADLGEVGGTTTQVTMALTLPAVTTTAVTITEVMTPYVRGRVYVDANQNGKSDRTEGGLAGVTVTFGSFATTTAADGTYRLHVTGADSPPTLYSIPAPTVAGYTGTFPVYIPSAEVTEPPTPPYTTTNRLPASVTIDSLGAITATPQSYLNQVLPPPYTLPMWDEDGQRVEPKLNFGFVRADQAGIYQGACGGQLGSRLYDLGTVKNGFMTATVASSLANIIGANTTNNISVLREGAVIACGDIVVGAPTAFSDGRGSTAKFRIILRVDDDNTLALLPYYALNEKQRVSAANFLSLQAPITITGPFSQTGTALTFDMTIPGNDPLNPFKHKYNPDHDNLDRAFAPVESSKLYESYDLDRLITLTLRDLPRELVGKPQAEAEAAAQSLDWGGAVWGGDYREVLDGLHKNTITVRGTFIIRQMLSFDQLVKQDYDK